LYKWAGSPRSFGRPFPCRQRVGAWRVRPSRSTVRDRRADSSCARHGCAGSRTDDVLLFAALLPRL